MKFSIGDIVLLKRTGEEGRVAGILNNDMIEVEVGGTHFPVFLDEVEHPYLKWFTAQRKTKPPAIKYIDDIQVEKHKKNAGHSVSSGFHLSFLPVFKFDEFEDVVDKLKAYFINQTNYNITLHYECTGHTGSLFSHKTTLQPFAHFYLHDIPFSEMHEQPRFSWIIEQINVLSPAKPLKDTIRIKPRKLFGFINKLQQENHPMFHIKLADDFSTELDYKDTQDDYKSKESLVKMVEDLKYSKTSKPKQEVDLHIEKLVDDINNLSNYEMLSIQLNAFEHALDNAILHHQQSLIIIHGVGKGKLKEEIHILLKSVPEVVFFRVNGIPDMVMVLQKYFSDSNYLIKKLLDQSQASILSNSRLLFLK